MKFTYKEVSKLVDDACIRLRMEREPYRAPETFDGIGSTQVKAVVEVMVALLNQIVGEKKVQPNKRRKVAGK